MASLKKIKTKGGQVRYRVQYRVEGRVVEKWHRTLESARAEKTRAESDALEGIAIDPRRGTTVLNEYFAGWSAARLVTGRPLRQSTRDGYERLWRRTISPTIGTRQLRAVRPESVREWHGEVSKSAGQDQAAKAYRLLHAVLATAETDDLIRANPCRIRGAGQEHAEERPLAPTSLVLELADEIGTPRNAKGERRVDKAGAVLPTDRRYRALVLTVGFASLRTGEVLGLRRCDVDLLHREVHVEMQAQELRGRGRAVLEHTKNDAGRRIVAIPQLVVDALDEHLRDFTSAAADAPVFTGPEGTPLRRATLSTVWRAAKLATGAPTNLRLYDLRHHAATLTARTPGITTKELMARIGHSSWSAALRYQHATRERDRVVASFLDEQIAAAERPKHGQVLGLA